MGRFRKLVEGAFEKLDEINEKEQAKQVAKLTPAERERYEASVARTEAMRAGVSEEELGDARLTGKIMQGPAGEVLAGITKRPKLPEPIEDQARWEEIARSELAARDRARAPYLAAERRPVVVKRVMTRRDSQLEDVCEHLGTSGLSARPELVYGAAPVPDLLDPSRFGAGKHVEWDIVHAAERDLPPAEAAASVTLESSKCWVDRAAGENRPADEDIGLDIIARAGLRSRDTLGIARSIAFGKTGGGADDDGTPRVLARVDGVSVIVGGGAGAAAGIGEAMGAHLPWQLGDGPPAGIVVEALQWEAIAQVVHPVRQQRAPLPSPFPYLPMTPQELLRSYVEIVGLDPADCFAAEVTYERAMDLMGRSSMKWGVRRTGGGPELPCADGVARKRMAGGRQVVVAYRDQPAYAEGRERFDAYMREVLQADLRRSLGLRDPVPKPEGRLAKAIDRTADFVEFWTGDPGMEEFSEPPRYCCPPSRT